VFQFKMSLRPIQPHIQKILLGGHW